MSGKEKNHEESTRMIILGPSSRLSSSELVQRLHLLGLPLTIKSTCYGALVHGDTETVMEAVRKIRSLDPTNIFTKERGFPPGDPRRCRGHRGAAREGYHQLEKEFKLLGYVGEALERPQKAEPEKKEKVSVDEFRDVVERSLKSRQKT
ncbi:MULTISPECIES: methanogenesis marker 6 protein [Methanothermobacter]|uniref:Methanogenesis marker protein 6 n=1 Tax=Methanothermobacter marburgensis (strain ATCC BAA-927 / DSM 2133 / JCM 14651 / NBRC 100331 / OCM 82 / Marburg) TaxID=79929 RepID=D9PUZ1_METTM|nr:MULTISPECIES: methanogenesis marker 6 protein [Methanothermobacter]ADL58038.1 methanogenesis marker protein 6 [Methanothermobacter marburgensis str. Marburg]